MLFRSADSEAMGYAAYWLPPHGLLSLLSYRTHKYQSKDSTTHIGLNTSPSITHQENVPTDLAKSQSGEHIPSINVPSSQMTRWCQVDKAEYYNASFIL